MPVNIKAKLLAKEEIAEGILKFSVQADEIVKTAKAGNFIEIKVNDEIVTRGGIIGKISHIDEKTVTIETSSAKTKIKLDKSGIAYKTTNE